MECFKQNSCRLCQQVFCCVKCRQEHERSKHYIENPECDICMYGKAQLRDFSKELLEHIEKSHWPLHCLRCKRFFGTIDELVNHNKCLPSTTNNGNNNYNNTKAFGNFLKPPTDAKYESPSVSLTNQEFAGILPNVAATSTPTSKEECDDKENNHAKILTPVPCAEKSILVKVGLTPNDSKKNENSLKRKVTFCETPVLENSGRKKLLSGQKSESIEEEDVGPDPEIKTTVDSDTSKKNEQIQNSAEDRKSIEMQTISLADVNYYSPPVAGAAMTGSLLSGSNQQFYGKMINTAVTSTPMSNKDERCLEKVEIQNVDENSGTSQTPEEGKSKEEQMKLEIAYQTPLTSAPDKYRQALAHQHEDKKYQNKEQTPNGGTSTADEPSTQFFTPSADTWGMGKATEEDENKHNELVNQTYKKNKIMIEETLWMSAVNNLNTSQEGDIENDANQKGTTEENKEEIVSVEMKKVICLPDNITTVDRESMADISSKMNISRSGLWASMTQAIKSVVTGLSSIKSNNETGSSKRSWTDDEEDESGPDFKKMKITDIKCRRTIRAICPLAHSTIKIMVDKATQTD